MATPLANDVVTQEVIEVAGQEEPNIRISQVVAESMVDASRTDRISQEVIEVAGRVQPNIRVSQVVLEVMCSTSPSPPPPGPGTVVSVWEA